MPLPSTYGLISLRTDQWPDPEGGLPTRDDFHTTLAALLRTTEGCFPLPSPAAPCKIYQERGIPNSPMPDSSFSEKGRVV